MSTALPSLPVSSTRLVNQRAFVEHYLLTFPYHAAGPNSDSAIVASDEPMWNAGESPTAGHRKRRANRTNSSMVLL